MLIFIANMHSVPRQYSDLVQLFLFAIAFWSQQVVKHWWQLLTSTETGAAVPTFVFNVTDVSIMAIGGLCNIML